VPPPPQGKSSFSLQSGEIRKYLNATTSKLERLAKLASSKSVFDDPTSEIEELSFVVKGDIKQLQSRVSQLQGLLNQKKGGNAQMDKHSEAVVGAMQAQLMRATNGFKDVLMSRAENMKNQQDRRGQFGGKMGSFGQSLGAAAGSPSKQGPTVSSMFATPQQSSEMRARKPLLGGGGGSSLSHLDVEDAEEPLSDEDECVINVPSMAQMQMVPQNSYGEARAEAVENIQKTMVELGEVSLFRFFSFRRDALLSYYTLLQIYSNLPFVCVYHSDRPPHEERHPVTLGMSPLSAGVSAAKWYVSISEGNGGDNRQQRRGTPFERCFDTFHAVSTLL